MHRNPRVTCSIGVTRIAHLCAGGGPIGNPSSLYRTLFLGLILGSLITTRAAAQEGAVAPKVAPLAVPLNTNRIIQVSSKQKLKTVTNQDPNIARVAPVEGDPTRIQITGLRAGLTRITLLDERNFTEAYDVTVQTNLEHLRTVLRETVPT